MTRCPSTDFSGAEMSGDDLSGAEMSDVDLSGADMSGAIFSGAEMCRTVMHELLLLHFKCVISTRCPITIIVNIVSTVCQI